MNRQSATRGLLAFFIVLLMMPLGHAFVVLMGRYLTGWALNLSAMALGFVGLCFAIAPGGRNAGEHRGEAMAVLSGVFGAILFWGAWVEFIFINYAHSLHVPPLMDGDRVLTKPEYMMMPVTIPFAVLSLAMYTYFAETRWGAVIWLRKLLRISPPQRQRRYPAMSAFNDLVLLIWWAYLLLLVMYDSDLLGERHPVTLGFAGICLCVAIILFVRSLKAPDWSSALRQAIVTVCVLWTFVEVMIRLKLFTEVWIYPERYVGPMVLIVAAFVAAIFGMAYMGHRR